MFFSNALKVFTGNMLGLIVNFALMPVVSRIFSPEEYGVLSVFNAIVLSMLPFLTMGYEKALIICKEENQIQIFFLLSIISTLLWTMVFFVIQLFFASELCNILNLDSSNSRVFYYVVVGLAVAGINRALIFGAVRRGEFGIQGLSRLVEVITDKATSITGGYLWGGFYWLLLGRILGTCISIAMLVLGLGKGTWYKNNGFRALVSAAAAYWKFAYSALAAFINGIAREYPVVIISAIYSTHVAGLYGFSRQIIGIPLLQLSDAISRAFYHKAGLEHRNMQDSTRSSILLLKFHLIFVIPLMFILCLYIKELTLIVFGNRWIEAGTIVQYLALYFAFSFCYRSLSVLFDVKEKQIQRLVFNLLLITFSLLAIVVGSLVGGYMTSIVLYSFVSSILYLIGIVYLLYIVGCKSNVICRIFFPPIILLLIFAPSVYFSVQHMVQISILMTLVSYLLYLYLLIKYFYDDMVPVLFKMPFLKKILKHFVC